MLQADETNKKKYDKEIIDGIINGMYDWVRVLDHDNNIIFTNKAMSDNLGFDPVGMKCFQALGKEAPCESCISRQAAFDGISHEKEEKFGNKIFSVMSSPLRDKSGEIIAVVEVLRDVTQLKMLQQQTMQQNKRLKNDLNIARKLQCNLLPRELPDDKIKFSFLYKPCESLGGDFLDIFKIDEDHLGIYIADVSGHGVPASMLTVFLRSSIDKKTLSPADALSKLYTDFNLSNLDPELYITVFYAIIDFPSKAITYSNAGHNVCPILFNKSRLNIMRSAGIPISNWLDKPEYVNETMALEPQDRIFMYTDGIVELRNADKEQFGEERVLNILFSDAGEPFCTLNHIVKNAYEFAGIKDTSQLPDDITIALLEVK